MTSLTNPEIRRLRLTENLPGLIRELRCRREPEHRQQAALGLYELGDESTIPWLLQSALYDPDPYVRRGVHAILKDWLGNDLKMALEVEASGAQSTDSWLVDAHIGADESIDEEAWMEDEEVAEDVEYTGEDDGWFASPDDVGDRIDISDEHLTLRELDEIRGLIMIATGEGNPELRKRAVVALGKYPLLGVIEVLTSLADSDEDPNVRQAAYQVLEERFGDNLPALMESTRLAEQDTGEDDLDRESLTQNNQLDRYSTKQPEGKSQLVGRPIQPPVVQEEKTLSPVWLLLLVGVGIIGFFYVAGILVR